MDTMPRYTMEDIAGSLQPIVIRDRGTESGGAFVVFNTSGVSETIPQFGAPSYIPPFKVSRIHWAYDPYFYLAFLPVNRRMSSPWLFFDYTRYSVKLREVEIPKKRREGSYTWWGMDAELCTHIDNVRKSVGIIIDELSSWSGFGLPLTLKGHGLDEKMIWNAYERPQDAISNAMRVQNCLYSQLALLSYCITLVTGFDEGPDSLPRWRAYLNSRAQGGREGIPIAFLDALRDTWVFDLTQPRIGAYVDITKAAPDLRPETGSLEWCEHLFKVVKVATGVPIALYYPDPTNLPKDLCRFGVRFAPNVVDPIRPTPQSPPPISPSPSPSHPNASLLPSPSSVQRLLPSVEAPTHWDRYGPYACNRMTLWQWLAGLRVHTETVLATESQWARERRLAREAANASQPCPGKHGPSVYEWKKGWGDRWTCVNVSRKETTMRALWRGTTRSQRIYSAVLNEYHVSLELDEGDEKPEDAADEDEEEDEYDCAYDESLANPPHSLYPSSTEVAAYERTHARERSQSPPRKTSTDTHAGGRTHGRRRTPPPIASTSTGTASAQPHSSELDEALLGMIMPEDMFLMQPVDSFFDFITKRFGIAFPHPESFIPVDEVPITQAKKQLGFKTERDIDNLQEWQWRVLAALLHELGGKNIAPSSLTGSTAQVCLDTAFNSFVKPALATPNSGRSSFIIMRKRVGEKEYYLLRRRGLPDITVPWVLMVEDPLTAVEVVRRGWGPHSMDVARQLFQRGLPFRTVLPQPAPVLTLGRRGQRSGLGFFPKGYIPNKHDYAVYEATRDARLRQGGYMRAGLLMGGIVWRLVVHALGFDHVLTGPSLIDQARTYVVNFVDGPAVDDALTEDDLDIIVGVCRIRTGNKPEDASLSSWWPRHEQWMKSNYNHGHWTWLDELWFRARLEGIRNENESVRTSGHWKSVLKGDPEWGRLHRNLQTVARGFIERSFEIE